MLKIIKKLPRLTPRRAESHKGDFGKILILAGSKGMTGAAYLCAQAALRSGAGLVTVATPAGQQPILAAKLTCALTAPLPETRQGTVSLKAKNEIINRVKDSGVFALGPGLSQHPETICLIQEVLLEISRFSLKHIPLVIDADGLNALSLPCRQAGHQMNILNRLGRTNPVVLTPHPGEMKRLINKNIIGSSSSERIKTAVGLAEKYGIIVVLKGYQTVVTDGKQVYGNRTGNPGMASGGTGDVLTGMIAGLLGSASLTPFEAAQLGVYLHGRAGDLAVKKIGQVSLLATDLLDYLPRAFTKHRK